MALLSEVRHRSEFIASEAPGTQSREVATVTVLANSTYPVGTVLKLASGKYLLSANSQGNDCVAVLMEEVSSVAGGDVTALILARDAEVNKSELNFKYNNTGTVTAIAAGVDQGVCATNLATKGIIVRSAV